MPAEWRPWFEGILLWHTTLIRMIHMTGGLVLYGLAAALVLQTGKWHPQTAGVVVFFGFLVVLLTLTIWMLAPFQQSASLMPRVPPSTGETEAIASGVHLLNVAGVVMIVAPPSCMAVALTTGGPALLAMMLMCTAVFVLCSVSGLRTLVRATSRVATGLGLHPAARRLSAAAGNIVSGVVMVVTGAVTVVGFLSLSNWQRPGPFAEFGCGAGLLGGVLFLIGLILLPAAYINLEAGLRLVLERQLGDEPGTLPPAYRVGSTAEPDGGKPVGFAVDDGRDRR